MALLPGATIFKNIKLISFGCKSVLSAWWRDRRASLILHLFSKIWKFSHLLHSLNIILSFSCTSLIVTSCHLSFLPSLPTTLPPGTWESLLPSLFLIIKVHTKGLQSHSKALHYGIFTLKATNTVKRRYLLWKIQLNQLCCLSSQLTDCIVSPPFYLYCPSSSLLSFPPIFFLPFFPLCLPRSSNSPSLLYCIVILMFMYFL